MPIYTNAYIGKKYGKLIITGQGPYNEKYPYDTLVYVDCDCGTKNKIVRFIDLTRTDIRQTTGKKNGTFTCGECYGKDLIGQKINHLTILELHPSQKEEDLKNGIKVDTSTMVSTELSKYRAKRCTVKCECGTSDPFIWILMDVKSGRKRQCDGFNCTYARRHTHKNDNGEKIGASEHNNPAYKTWYLMHKRCYDPNHNSYPQYGGRGIGICKEWNKNNQQGLYNFSIWWIKHKPTEKIKSNWTVDRIDSTKDYSPDNCRFASKSTQSANRQTYAEHKREIKHLKRVSQNSWANRIEFNGVLGEITRIPNKIEGILSNYILSVLMRFEDNILDPFPYEVKKSDKIEINDLFSIKKLQVSKEENFKETGANYGPSRKLLKRYSYVPIKDKLELIGLRRFTYKIKENQKEIWINSIIAINSDLMDRVLLKIWTIQNKTKEQK